MSHPDVIEFKGHKWHFDMVAPLTGDKIYKRTDAKTGAVFHCLVVKL